MSSGSSGGAHVERKLVESNAGRSRRPIVWRCRHLKGWKGSYMKLSNGMNRTLLGDTPYPECVYMHWGLQIGPYLYELLTDEGFNGHLMNRRLVQDQPEFWESAVQDQVVGYTALTDREINSAARDVRDHMASGEPAFAKSGRYHYSKNNCQNFVLGLAGSLILADSPDDVANTDDARYAGWRTMSKCILSQTLDRGFKAMSSWTEYKQNAKDMLSGSYRKKHYDI